MTEPADGWVDRLKDLTGDASGTHEEKAQEFVQELYTCAQKDLDAERAQAEYEREE